MGERAAAGGFRARDHAVTTNIRALVASRHIPTVAVAETLEPPDDPFQGWQLKQLRSLEAALSATS